MRRPALKAIRTAVIGRLGRKPSGTKVAHVVVDEGGIVSDGQSVESPNEVAAAARRLPRLDRMHSIGIAVLAALVLTSQVLLQVGFDRELGDAPLINLAGRQRMLSQRIAKVVLQIEGASQARRTELRIELSQAIAEWMGATAQLDERAREIATNAVMRQTLKSNIETLRYSQDRMSKAAFALVDALASRQTDQTAIEDQVGIILEDEPHFLTAMEIVVRDFERAAGEHVRGVRTMSLVLCIATVLMLGYQGLLVFRPAFRVIRRQFAALKGELSRRVEVEAALRASEEWATALIGQLQNGICVFDQDGRVTAVNSACEKMFRMRGADMLGKTPKDLFADAESKGDAESFRRVVTKIISRISELTGVRSDGTIFPCEVWTYEAHLPSGLSYVCDMRDVTERREVERLKKEFVSTVSHELRTPLTSIRGSLSLLSAGVLGDIPAEASDVVNIAERNVMRLIALINDILDLEKLDDGKLEMHFESTTVQSLTSRAAEAVRGLADTEAITLHVERTSALANVDADRIVQVLVNLLSNAIKFSPRGSTVSIATTAIADYVEMRVIDHGRGIPKEARELIFERFRQVEASDSRRKGGTGLGLSISKAIITQHMGTISVESEAGKGSTFIIRVPRAFQARALVCESDPTLRATFVTALETRGYDVRVASTSDEAISVLNSAPPDVAVLDLNVDVATSPALLEAAHQAQAIHGMPILFVGDHILLSPEQHSHDLTRFLAAPAETREFADRRRPRERFIRCHPRRRRRAVRDSHGSPARRPRHRHTHRHYRPGRRDSAPRAHAESPRPRYRTPRYRRLRHRRRPTQGRRRQAPATPRF